MSVRATVVWIGPGLRCVRLSHDGPYDPSFIFEEEYRDALGALSWKIVLRVEEPDNMLYKVMATMKEVQG